MWAMCLLLTFSAMAQGTTLTPENIWTVVPTVIQAFIINLVMWLSPKVPGLKNISDKAIRAIVAAVVVALSAYLFGFKDLSQHVMAYAGAIISYILGWKQLGAKTAK